MARIRTIKPDCLQHRKVGRLSDRCVRVWLGMLTQADDEGRLPCDPGQVLSWCGYSYHRNVTEEHVEAAIQAIADMGLIRLYSVNGTRYAYFHSFRDHQVINKPSESKLPDPPVGDSIEVTTVGVPEHYRPTTDGLEGKGREGMGKGKEVEEAREVLRWLNIKAGRTYAPNGVNLGFVTARLKEGALPEQLKAVVSRKVREWQGTDMAKYLRPATLFNAEKCSQYLGELPAPTQQQADDEHQPADAEHNSEVTRAEEGTSNVVPT